MSIREFRERIEYMAYLAEMYSTPGLQASVVGKAIDVCIREMQEEEKGSLTRNKSL